jgi:hypothetical protein
LLKKNCHKQINKQQCTRQAFQSLPIAWRAKAMLVVLLRAMQQQPLPATRFHKQTKKCDF